MASDDRDAPRASLIGQIARAARARTTMPAALDIRRSVAAGVGALLISAPLLTWGGAWAIERSVRAQARGIVETAAPRIVAARERDATRAALGRLLARPTLAATIDALARALPADAALTRAARDGDGRLAIEVAAPDPDRLRAALRRDDATRGLRDAGQRRGDGAMLVALEETR